MTIRAAPCPWQPSSLPPRSASRGSATLSVEGGHESDGITPNGTLDDATINADDFSAEGTFGQPNLAGESFSLSGTGS